MTKKMQAIQITEELGSNIRNTRAFSTGDGQLVLMIDLNNKHNLSEKEVVNHYTDIGNYYKPTEGQKGKESIFITPLNTDNPYLRYDTINMNGINHKVQLNIKIEKDEIDRVFKAVPKKKVNKVDSKISKEDAKLFQEFLEFKKMMQAAQGGKN